MKGGAGQQSGRAWDLNPVVVKELRQAMRGWFIASVLMLFLTVLLVCMLAYLASSAARASAVEAIGSDAFWYLMIILSVACTCFVPIYAGTRLTLERRENNLDLLYVTTLSPHRIVMGKVLSGVYLALLLFSASMPFILLTNLLGGVDLRGILMALAFLFGLVCIMVELAILIGCLGVSPLFKGLLGLATLWPLGAVIALGSHGGRVSGPLFSASFTARGLGLTATIFVGLLIWLHLSSVALISPRSINRARPVRVYCTFVWFAVGVGCLCGARSAGGEGMMSLWLVFSAILSSMALVMAISAQDELSLRVRRTIPRRPWARWAALPFFSGAAQGAVWALGLMVATVALAALVHSLDWLWLPSVPVPGAQPLDQELLIKLLGSALYVCAYCFSGLFVQRQFLPKRPSMVAGIIGFAIPAGLSLGPMLGLFLIDQLSWQSLDTPQLGSLFNLLAIHPDTWRHPHLLFSGSWALVGFCLNVPWLLRQVRAFVPPTPAPTPSPA